MVLKPDKGLQHDLPLNDDTYTYLPVCFLFLVFLIITIHNSVPTNGYHLSVVKNKSEKTRLLHF